MSLYLPLGAERVKSCGVLCELQGKCMMAQPPSLQVSLNLLTFFACSL
jgi:hypothetical protein